MNNMRRFGLRLCGVLLVVAVASTGHASIRTHRALVLGIDGLRGDALHRVIEQGRAAINIQNLIIKGEYAACPDTKKSTCAKAHEGNDFKSDFVWKTGPGWGSVISGLDARRHNIKNIGHKDMKAFTETTKTYPTIFKLLKTNGLRTAALGVGAFLTSFEGKKLYPGIVDYECGAGSDGPTVKPSDTRSCNLDYRFTTNNEDNQRDNKITDTAISYINRSDIEFIMLVLDEVDEAGHKNGFDLTLNYLRAIQDADVRVGKIVAAIEKRVKDNNEDWLVILTSDHGGHNQSAFLKWLPGVNSGIHGTESGKDNIVPFIVSTFAERSPVKFDVRDKTDVRHFDTFKTIATWFGLAQQQTVSTRDGQSRIR